MTGHLRYWERTVKCVINFRRTEGTSQPWGHHSADNLSLHFAPAR